MNQYSIEVINLMPFRQKQREKSCWYGIILLVFSAFFAVVIFILIELLVRDLSRSQIAKNDFMAGRNQVLQQQVASLSIWEKKNHDRLHLLAYLKNKTNSTIRSRAACDVVRFLIQLKGNLPISVALNQINQHGNQIRLTGSAGSNTAMTSFMHGLALPVIFAAMPFFELKQRSSGVVFTVEVNLNA